ncbi:MAG TPA: invasion associated locus B family protein [Rhizomicrobium sp.]|nr:invasion associated locus B family protein [Rhizomicrobium sp.]
MIRRIRFALGAVLGVAAFAAASAGATADATATLLGVSKDWSALTSGTGTSKICYALSKPISTDPRKAKRDPIYFLITDWPGRRAKSEPQAVPGYQYREGSTVIAQVGDDKFEMFTQNDGGAGSAWVRQRADEVRLVDAMKRGQQLIVIGTSKRGTMTHDTYSLAGLSDALDKIHTACGM